MMGNAFRRSAVIRAGCARQILAIAVVLALIATPAFAATTAQEAGPAILDISVNGVERGRFVVEITEAGDVLLQIDDFESLQVVGLPAGAGRIDDRQVSLRALAPGLRFAIDAGALELRILARPELLTGTEVNLRGQRPPPELVHSNNVLVSYDLRWGLESDASLRSLALPWDLAANFGPLHLDSAFSYTYTPGNAQFVRNLTSLIWDSPASVRRATAGDVAFATGRLGGGGVLGGLGVASEYSLRPDMLRIPTFEIGALIETASDVSVYVNGGLVSTRRVAPGTLRFLDLQLPPGASDVELVVRDDAGREERIRDAFYFSSRLLRPGLHEYAYAAGLERANVGTDSFDYDRLTFAGFHRYGFSRAFTAGIRAEAQSGLWNVGSSVTTLLGRAGEIETGLAYSWRNGVPGYAGFFDWRYFGRGLSLRGSFEGRSDDYATVVTGATGENRDQDALRVSAGAGYSLARVGALSADVAWTRAGESPWRTALTGRWTRSIARRASLQVGVARQTSPVPDTVVNVGVNLFLSTTSSARASYDMRDGRDEALASLQRARPFSRGVSYSLEAARDLSGGGASTNGRGQIGYRARFADLGIEVRTRDGDTEIDLRAAGTVAFVAGSVFASRPVNQGFAVVDLRRLSGVDVFLRNHHMGATGRSGRLFLPDVVPYFGNSIRVSAKGLPVDVRIGDGSRNVGTPYRSGGIIGFDVLRLRTYGGRLLLRSDGQERPAELAELTIDVAGEQLVNTIVGRGGEIYLENLPPGEYSAALTLRGLRCEFALSIPDSDEPYTDLGELSCDADASGSSPR